MGPEPSTGREDSIERQLVVLSRQLAHNAIDQDASLAAAEHALSVRIDALEARVAALENERKVPA